MGSSASCVWRRLAEYCSLSEWDAEGTRLCNCSLARNFPWNQSKSVESFRRFLALAISLQWLQPQGYMKYISMVFNCSADSKVSVVTSPTFFCSSMLQVRQAAMVWSCPRRLIDKGPYPFTGFLYISRLPARRFLNLTADSLQIGFPASCRNGKILHDIIVQIHSFKMLFIMELNLSSPALLFLLLHQRLPSFNSRTSFSVPTAKPAEDG